MSSQAQINANRLNSQKSTGPNQLALVDTLIAAEWTQRRLRRIEAELWNSRDESLDPPTPVAQASACHVGNHADTSPEKTEPLTPPNGFVPPVTPAHRERASPEPAEAPDWHDKLNEVSDAGQPLLVEPTIDSNGVA